MTTRTLIIHRILALLLLILPAFLYGCGVEVPADRVQYVGEWQCPEMYLLITQDGSVKYERIKGGVKKSVSGPLRRFEGDNFIVGVAGITTTFVVSKPPYQEDGKWKMVVDGLTLTRTAR